MASVIFEEQISVPMDLHSLASFRDWALSDQFPQYGRIDFITGDIEVDMSPEDLFTHGNLKGKVYSQILSRVEELDLGYLFTDATRLSSQEAALSVEPDIVLISHESLDSGDASLTPKASGEPGRYVEIEGAADLVVEIVSDSSSNKDQRRLPKAYFAAGVKEYWLLDARSEELVFQIFRRGENRFDLTPPDEKGYTESTVLKESFRLERQKNRRGHWVYDLLCSTAR